MKRSTAATTAAASSGEAFGATIVSFGRRFTSRRERIVRARCRSCPSTVLAG
jgi:hypothetical protein